MVYANRACGDCSCLDSERLEQIGPYGKAGFAAEPAHPVLGIVPGERGQVDAGNGLEEPSGLVDLFDRAPGGQGLAPALDGGGVGLDGESPVEVKFRSRISWVLVGMVVLTHSFDDRGMIFRIRPLCGKGRVFNEFGDGLLSFFFPIGFFLGKLGGMSLFEQACEVRENAHAPYSGFKVGAALRVSSGKTFVGCNVENAAYPEGTCAEAGQSQPWWRRVNRKSSRFASWRGEASRFRLAEVADKRFPSFPNPIRPSFSPTRTGIRYARQRVNSCRIHSSLLTSRHNERTRHFGKGSGR